MQLRANKSEVERRTLATVRKRKVKYLTTSLLNRTIRHEPYDSQVRWVVTSGVELGLKLPSSGEGL